MKRSLLKNHITEILALILTISFVAIIVLILMKEVKSDKETTYLIVGNYYGLIMLIAGFHWGASKIRNPNPPSNESGIGSDEKTNKFNL